MHLLWSMVMTLFTREMACSGHSLTHFWQAMQPTSQYFLTVAPLSRVEHSTATFSPLGTMRMRWRGQASTHFLQATHFSSMMRAMPSSVTMASKAQARVQLPRPRQPAGQTLVADVTRSAATQSAMPM